MSPTFCATTPPTASQYSGGLAVDHPDDPEPMQWSRRLNSARHQPITGQINGYNMTMPRVIVEKVGPFDERFGPGGVISSGGDSDYLFRAYLAGFTLAYVPDMMVVHHYGRKTAAQGRRLQQGYLIGTGAVFARHAPEHFNFCRPFLWDCKNAVKEILAGGSSTTTLDYFSHHDKVVYAVRGALRYIFIASHKTTRTLWDEEQQHIASPIAARNQGSSQVSQNPTLRILRPAQTPARAAEARASASRMRHRRGSSDQTVDLAPLSDNLARPAAYRTYSLTEVAAAPVREVAMNLDKRLWYAIAVVIVVVILVVVYWERHQRTEPPAPATTSAPATSPTPAPSTTPKP